VLFVRLQFWHEQQHSSSGVRVLIRPADASNQAGISRRYGGIHFKADDLTGRTVGKKIGNQAWLKAQSYFNGTAH